MNHTQFAAFDGFEGLPTANLKDEVRKKLANTFLVMGKTLVYASEINDLGISCSYLAEDGDKKTIGVAFDSIKNIAPYLPDTGIYETKAGVNFLEKLPRKQWKKSFSWDFYTYHFIDDNDTNEIFELPFLMYNSKNYSSDILISGDTVYYLYKKIGKVVDNLIKCTDDLFKQELIDYTREHPQWTIQK